MKEMFEEIKPSGFIADYSKIILESIPTSPDWVESIALSIEATVLGKVKVLTKIGPLSLNVWNMMIGPSGLAYKSTPLMYFVYPTLAGVAELIGKPIIMPGKFSVEGLIEYLSMRHMRGELKGELMHDEGIIVRDEFTSLFKGVYNKGYLADVLEFMSELYDGQMQKRYTKSAKLEESKHVYICLLAATTPYLFSIMERDFFIQGTGNRILYTMFEPKVLPVIDPNEFFMSGGDYMKRVERTNEFARKLADMYNSNLRYIFPMPEAADLWTKYKMEKDKEAAERYRANPQDLQYSYIQRITEMTLKIAALATVSRAQDSIGKLKSDTLMITEEDMKWAIMKTEKHLEYFRMMLDKWTIVPVSKPVETEEKELKYLLSFIEGNPDHMLTQQELLSLSGYVKNTRFYELIKTLSDMGMIRQLSVEEIKELPKSQKEKHKIKEYRGTPPAVYALVKR